MFKTILLATKFSPKAGLAREVAIELATALRAQLHILAVYDSSSMDKAHVDFASIPEELKARVRENLDATFKDYLAEFEKHGLQPVKIVKFGNPETEIVATAGEIQADLIIIGSGTRKGVLLDRFLQNVADKVRKHASCHVLTIV
ncbi:MAG: universal stress protein [Kiritimatiellae bacterium]|nr:universal stress protein [Kiritimatiellia bacterium]